MYPATIIFTGLAVILFGFFVVGAVFNLKSWIKRGRGEHYPSIVPLIPGIVGCVACCIYPHATLLRWAWLPLVLDVGCAPYFLGVSVHLLHDWWITRPSSKLQELHGGTSEFTVKVELFRTGQVRLLKTNLLPASSRTLPHWLTISNGGTWKVDQDELVLATYQGTLRYIKTDASTYVWVVSDKPTHFDNIHLEVVSRPT